MTNDQKPKTNGLKPTFPAATARRVAEKIVEELRPFAYRIEIAGSLRRNRPAVHDIDLVVEPRFEDVQNGLFETVPVNCVRERVLGWETEGRVKITTRGEQILRFVSAKSGVPVDIYFALPITLTPRGIATRIDTFPTTLLIRTGSAEHNVFLARRARERGLHLHADGQGVSKNGQLQRVECEADIFRLLGLEYAEPEAREVADV